MNSSGEPERVQQKRVKLILDLVAKQVERDWGHDLLTMDNVEPRCTVPNPESSESIP